MNDPIPQGFDDSVFRALVEQSSDITVTMDALGAVLYVNPAVEAMLGYLPGELIGKSAFDIVHPDDRPELEAAYERLIRNPGERITVRERMVSKSGQWRVFESRAVNFLDNPAVRAVICNSTDITDLVATLAKASRNEARLNHAQSVARMGSWEFDLHTGTMVWSDQMYRIFGFEPAPGPPPMQEAFKRIHPDDLPLLSQANKKRLQTRGKETLEYRILTPGEPERVVFSESEISFGPGGVPARMTGTVQDITDRKQGELALRQTEERLRLLLECSEDIIVMHDLEGNYIFYAGSDTYGVTARDLIGKNIRDMFPEKQAERILDQHRRVMKTGRALTVENELTWRGHPLWLLTTTYPVLNARGNIAAIGAIGRNITLQKEAEREKQALQEQLNHIQKLDAVGALAGGIAHEFNNMLAIIMGNASLLLDNAEQTGEGREELEEIIKAGERARDLSMKLLTFARRDKLHVQNIRMAELITEFATMLRSSYPPSIQVRWSAPDDLCVIADVPQMRQVLLNLCNNAQDAMPRGGLLAIEAADIRISESEAEPLAGMPPGRYCLVTVRDTGTGIPAPIRERIFDPFFTTKGVGRGVGLGLSIAHGIVRNHDGRIFVDDHAGPGAAVAFCIPASEMLLEPAPVHNPAQSGGRTVLVVDDEPVLLTLAQRILERSGFHVITADSGTAALDTFRHLHVSIDLVLLDMLLPDMGGADVCRALLEIKPDAVILLCSGASQAQTCQDLVLNGGPAGFLQKPFTMDSLIMSVHGALAQPRSAI